MCVQYNLNPIMSQEVNWVSVINFLEKEHSKISLREKEWLYEKELLSQKISDLQAQVRSNVVVCENLVNRIKMLEIALTEEKFKKSSGKKIVDEQNISKIVQRYHLTKQINKNQETHEEFLNNILKDLKQSFITPTRILPKPSQPLSAVISQANGDKKFSQTKKFGAHLDVITTVNSFDLNGEHLFATSSEDCLIKVWNTTKLLKEDAPEPIYTLRKHTGPLFALTSCPNPHNNSEIYLFSGGIEGDIKSWKISAGNALWNKSWLNGVEEEQTIWQLQAQSDKLLSSSSDGFARLFKIQGTQQLQLTLLRQFKEKQFNQTSLKWISSEYFLAGSSSAPRLMLWNVEGGLQSRFLYQIEKGREGVGSQVNKIEVMRDKKIILGGCEDAFVRIFDIDSGKIIKKLPVEGSVGSMMTWDWNILAGDHKGNLTSWEVRTFREIEKRQSIHLQKYDSGVTSLAKSGHFLVTSGADGIIKLFV